MDKKVKVFDMGCKTCKEKTKNTIKSLQNIDFSQLEKAYNLLQTPSLMDDEKWDYVEDIYMELFPSKKPIQRNCRTCLINVAKSIEWEYNKRKKEN